MKKVFELNDIGPVICEFINNGNKVRFKVTGNSMYPLMRNGLDTVTLGKKEKYEIGDIVFYRRNTGEYILHRIVGKEGEDFLIRGDNEEKKEKVEKNKVIAGVTECKRSEKDINFSALYYKFYIFLLIRFPFLKKIIKNFANVMLKYMCYIKK